MWSSRGKLVPQPFAHSTPPLPSLTPPLLDTHTQGPTLAFPVPLALAPPRRRTYGRGELHARAARRLLLTQPAAPSPLPPCDALRFGGYAPSRPHNACHLPFAGEAAAIEEPRDAAAAARSPPLHRANPPDCPHSFPARERRSPLACQSLPGSSPSAEDTRECAGRRDANAAACCP